MSAKRKKVSPQAAVKTFSGGIGFALLGIAVITYVIFSLRMASVESEAGAGADRFPLLSAALIILPIGMAAAFSAARVKQLWYIKPFMGLTAVAFSLVICFISVMLRMFGEHDPMWIIESLAELAAISGCAAAVLSLILGDFGAKVAPGVGSFASGACIVGPVLVVVRTIISFSAVISSAGESLDFEKAAELQDELSWTLVSVEATSALASKMFYARLAERIALAALLLCCAAVFARFSSFFKNTISKSPLQTIIQTNL